MSFTSTEAIGVLNRRVGQMAALADAEDAIASASRFVGVPTAAIHRVTDSELATLAVGREEEFLKVAELRYWETILGNIDGFSLAKIGVEDSVAIATMRAKMRIDALSKYLKDVHGIGLAQIAVGVIGLDFQATGDCSTDDPEDALDGVPGEWS